MINIYIIRHGEAQVSAAKDSERALTDNGALEIRRMAEWFRRDKKPEIGSIVASPYVRAQQSAEIFHQVLQFSGPVRSDEALIPESSPDELRRFIKRLKETNILLVSHMPLVGNFITHVMKLEEKQAHAIPTGTLTHLKFESIDGYADIEWMMFPGQVPS